VPFSLVNGPWLRHVFADSGYAGDKLKGPLVEVTVESAAADVVAQMFPVGAGNDPETLRRHTLKSSIMQNHQQCDGALRCHWRTRGRDALDLPSRP
jgi:hypothetical protein